MEVEKGMYVWDGAHVMRVLTFERLDDDTLTLVGRWVTKTGRLYANGYPYMVLEHNIIYATRTLHEMEKKLDNANAECGGVPSEQAEEKDDGIMYVYNVKKTTISESEKKTKDLGIYRNISGARKCAEKEYHVMIAEQEVIEDECTSSPSKWFVSRCDGKKVIIEIIEKKLK